MEDVKATNKQKRFIRSIAMSAHFWGLVCGWMVFSIACADVRAVDMDHDRLADTAAMRGIAFLSQRQSEFGSWSPQIGPAVTAMVLTVMLDRPDLVHDDLVVDRALAFILSKCRDNGGIHDGILQNYNTAICLSALARARQSPRVVEAIDKGCEFLRQLQWYDQVDPKSVSVGPEHPFYGGAGYGKHGRPDLSNTQIMLQGLYDAGLSPTDPVFQRALVFISRCQGTAANMQCGDQIVQDGGFVYSTSIDKNHIGISQSLASPELRDEAILGKPVTGLRTYGSMTYAGFKSYVYAMLSRDDPRVIDAYNWIRRHYTVDHNPGMPEGLKLDGYFYYLMTMSRALDVWGSRYIETPDGYRHDWSKDMTTKLLAMQRADGSWWNKSGRWMENDTNLVTAYALIALVHALK